MNEQQWIEKLEAEGYRDLTVFTNGADAVFGEHTHHVTTVHVILKGALITQENGQERVIKQGERFEFPAGTTHTAKCGPDGCTMIVGIKGK